MWVISSNSNLVGHLVYGEVGRLLAFSTNEKLNL